MVKPFSGTDGITQRLLKEEADGLEQFGFYNSRHEAYALMLEEMDELWDEIKANNHGTDVIEARQVAALALRFVREFG